MQWVKGSGVAANAAQIQSWEIPYAMDEAIKKINKLESVSSFSVLKSYIIDINFLNIW